MNDELANTLAEKIVDCTASLAGALQEAGVEGYFVRANCDMTVRQFIADVGAPNRIRFVYVPLEKEKEQEFTVGSGLSLVEKIRRMKQRLLEIVNERPCTVGGSVDSEWEEAWEELALIREVEKALKSLLFERVNEIKRVLGDVEKALEIK